MNVLGPTPTPGAQYDLGGLADLDRLVGPLGVVHGVQRLPNQAGEPGFPIYVAQLGDLSPLSKNVRESTRGGSTRGQIDGAGGALDAEKASRLCLAEAIERYASCFVPDDQLVWASSDELGDEAINLRRFPQCSEAELRNPRSIHAPVDTTAPIRWVRGWSLTRSRPVYVPAVSTWLYIPARTRAERFTMPISTGCATHTSLAQAVVNGLSEVIERDSIALTWLQRIPWPQLEIDVDDERLAPFLERYRTSHVRTRFYDATTDAGVPTFYSVDVTPENEVLGQLVMANTSLDPIDSVAKMLRESASSRIAMQASRGRPTDIDEFTSVFHGASYMGAPQRIRDYDFLLESDETRRLSEIRSQLTGDPESDLQGMLERLARINAEVIVVEITTEEARAAGFRVVRVLVPELMPLSFVHTGRYLAHPRLYEAPVAMGYAAADEAGINPLPQPFA
ncbi:cytoplasmic protein [Rathayibacter rathayi]|uniref:Cytoplasmic protein n=1 Tax=Rathayibacter rathayi TaxID=33887 RepID=A0ABD6WBJ4_RATRA|nr:YcaO-like family protein [Rathayibacter rathayi]AZZ47931.1 cytoplasmic protein [Rathayibacter rathayi]MWV74809.1 cytoplasmic protein [Rathayibacter rathayi NCPPB 2980 = VKM Ac-1601]PPF15579.1 cytoplasmic protein [Rathayibacter rathayi]PPF51280.1 cytoplasmic protein [Rathayibacter rathayi]PPF80362.1 cytoplasmic protein [Rathayibacter rathayi]